MTQSIGAYLDSVLWVVLGVTLLFFAPALMGKSPQGARNAKYLPMVKICGALLLLVGLLRFASKLFGWGI